MYRAYGRVVAMADVITAALLLGLSGSELSFASLCVNFVMRLFTSWFCAVWYVDFHCGSAFTMAPKYLN